ncbi:hypothetical protein JW824_05545 [bacterium]|nr:hypothetical protein [bacterium]RQV96340.1 MAG: hypothetical protein EH221_05055 [bacterium]
MYKRYISSKMGSIIVLFMFFMISVHTPIMGQSQDNAPFEPCRLFTIPTTETLPLGTFSLGGGQSFGKFGSDLFGRIAVGIAPYTEVQINTQKVVYDFINKEKIFTSLTPALKLQIPYLGENSEWIPMFGIALRHNFRWLSDDQKLNGTVYRYDKSWTNLFISGSKTVLFDNNIELYLSLGYKINSVRIRLNNKNGNRVLPAEEDYYHQNVNGIFGGTMLRTGKNSWMMMEVEPIPNIGSPELKNNQPFIDKNTITKIWLVTLGTRYYLKHWIGFDIGIQYRSDKKDIADISILCGLNVTVPLKKMAVSKIEVNSKTTKYHNSCRIYRL